MVVTTPSKISRSNLHSRESAVLIKKFLSLRSQLFRYETDSVPGMVEVT